MSARNKRSMWLLLMFVSVILTVSAAYAAVAPKLGLGPDDLRMSLPLGLLSAGAIHFGARQLRKLLVRRPYKVAR